jgi:hypothetical protein
MPRHEATPAAQPASTAPVVSQPPAVLSDTDMDTARAAGQATPLGDVITFIQHHQGFWWLSTKDGWLRIPPPLSDVLDTESRRIQAQDAAVARRAAIREAIALAREAAAKEEQ